MKTLIRITTIPLSLKTLLEGQPAYMRENGFKVIMISADGPERNDLIKQEKCEHIIVPMTRTISPVQDIICLIKLIRILKKYKPDIVHTHTPKAGLLGMLAAKICGVKVRIHTVAGLPLMVTSGIKKSILKITERVTSAAAQHVWPNSNSLLNYMKQQKLAASEKLSVIKKGSSNGIDLKRFNRANLNAEKLEKIKNQINYAAIKDSIKILCVGRMVKDKGIEELVNVFKDLLKKYNVHLLLIGPFEEKLDPLNSETKDYIKTCSSVTHINWSNEVEYYMSLADIFIHPSHREGFPNVILQAGAMNLPVIASNIPGNIDLIKHQKSGLLFSVTDCKDMYDKTEKLIADKKLAEDLALNLEKEIRVNYSRETIMEAILEKYTNLLAVNN